MAFRIVVTIAAICRVGQRYAVTVTLGDSPIYRSDAVGRSAAVRAAVAGARWFIRAQRESYRGWDIS